VEIRLLRKALAACMLLALGCVESTYVWTLNPEGSGKVEVEARLQPVSKAFGGGRNFTNGDPEQIAKAAVREILEESRGVDAWARVSSGIADDGRVLFRGTAYFGDLAGVKIKGDPFPASTFKPSLSEDGDGRLVVGLDLGGKFNEGFPPLGELDGLADVTTEEEFSVAVKRAKIGYQSVKPLLTAFLSTMKSETVVVLPGEVVEASNFRKRGDREISLVFDGPRTLRAFDELAMRDAVEWWKMIDSLRDTDADDALRRRLAEIVFGERAPVRAIVKTDGEPIFDYAKELAGVTDVRRELLGPSWRGPGGDGWWGGTGQHGRLNLAAGPLASARTDLGTGTGWTGILAGGGAGDFLDLHMRVEVSRVEYENSDGVRRELHRVAVGGGGGFGPVVLGGGLAFSFGPGDIWATGPQVSIGIGFFRGHAQVYLAGSGYAWIGEREDEFDFDLEGDVRLAAGIRF